MDGLNMLDLLRHAMALDASDLHLTVEVPPVVRVHGALQRLEGAPLTPRQTQELLYSILNDGQRRRFEDAGEIDFSYSVHGEGRFRINAYRQRGTIGVAVRLIPAEVRSFAALGLPPILADFARRPKGLVLVTGPTGSGKSTTLAAMIDLLNTERALHILTLEDPIEYLHRHKRSVVNQREVGTDTASFAVGLRAALREDPDVILVGEMRDPETMATALTAAETGHLVLATLHTVDTAQTVDRIIDSFPPHQQPQVRIQLAGTLVGIVAQMLLPRAPRDGGQAGDPGQPAGRVLAMEILVATPAVKNLIREGKTHQIPSAIQTGARHGMRSMEASLRELYQRGLISHEILAHQLLGEAVAAALQPAGHPPQVGPTGSRA